MNWKDDLTQVAQNVMLSLGSFSPTNRAEDAEMKGYMMDEDGESARTYFNSADLRTIAAGCTEVADWLDKQALAAGATSPPKASSYWSKE